jgi:hypothetical protein
MYRSRYERVSRLRRFVARRGKGEGGDLPSLIAEATRLLLLPSLRDVLGDAANEPVELRLTYAAACVVLADLLAQRFAPRQAQEAAAGAIRQIGAWSGLDDAQLSARASGTIAQLMETHPEIYRGLCDQFDAAIERAIVLGRPAQGEVQLRLALEAFEVAIQRLILGGDLYERPMSLIKNNGLLGVVKRHPPPPPPKEAPAGAGAAKASGPIWQLMPLMRLRLGRRTGRRTAGAPRR